MGCVERLRHAAEVSESLVCVGLDTDPDKLPAGLTSAGDVLSFNREIISATSGLACAYKPNSAFYEALGSCGMEILAETCRAVPSDIPVILDVKRGDIGNTAMKYAEAAYDVMGANAVTVNPYMGFDAVKPFLRDGKCVFVLCLTSNPSAGDFQTLDTGDGPLYERVARAAVEWAKEGEVGLVVGATRPEQLRRIREIASGLPILIPGIGAQGGEIEPVISSAGYRPGFTIINSSREILYASSGDDYAEAARKSLLNLRAAINRYRER
ncbi:MAG: orotidine-5'-phosphate decarboxylase [Candidatus Latescibacter sp.]|nr:orotidine-5'-phosphate decarboxylase [Candidatus Latescibacter sp.]